MKFMKFVSHHLQQGRRSYTSVMFICPCSLYVNKCVLNDLWYYNENRISRWKTIMNNSDPVCTVVLIMLIITIIMKSHLYWSHAYCKVIFIQYERKITNCLIGYNGVLLKRTPLTGSGDLLYSHFHNWRFLGILWPSAPTGRGSAVVDHLLCNRKILSSSNSHIWCTAVYPTGRDLKGDMRRTIFIIVIIFIRWLSIFCWQL